MLHGSQRVVNEELRIALGSRDLVRPRSSEILLVQQLRKRPQTIKDISSIYSDLQEKSHLHFWSQKHSITIINK